MRTSLLIIALATAGSGLGGCVGFTSTARTWWNPDTWGFRAWQDDPVVVDVPRPVAVDVENFNGSVVITCDPLLPKATLSVVREATHGYRRTAEAQASLGEIEYTARVVPSPDGPVLEVRTWTIHREPHFQRAHLHLQLPSATGIRVRTQRGMVTAVNVSGPVDIETTEGDVRVMTDLPLHEPVRITNRLGDIDYRVRGESTGVFDCEAVRGAVDHRIRNGRVSIHSGSDHDTLRATLNGGSNPIVLRTVDGDIRVAVVPNPTEIGAAIITP